METKFTSNVCVANEPGTEVEFSKGLRIGTLEVLTSVVENGIFFPVKVIVIGLGDDKRARIMGKEVERSVERTVVEGTFVDDKPDES